MQPVDYRALIVGQEVGDLDPQLTPRFGDVVGDVFKRFVAVAFGPAFAQAVQVGAIQYCDATQQSCETLIAL
jgi:hypothetical protein